MRAVSPCENKNYTRPHSPSFGQIRQEMSGKIHKSNRHSKRQNRNRNKAMDALLTAISSGPKLKPNPFTVITLSDGSRYLESKDGSRHPLTPDATDEEHSWAIIDERGDTKNDDGKSEEPSQLMTVFISSKPEFAPFLKLIQLGAPIDQVSLRLSMSIVEPSSAAAFLKLAIAENFYDKNDIIDDADFKTVSEMHGHLGDPTWPAPRLAVACEVYARPGLSFSRISPHIH